MVSDQEMHCEPCPDPKWTSINNLVQTVDTHQKPSVWNCCSPKNSKCSAKDIKWFWIKRVNLCSMENIKDHSYGNKRRGHRMATWLSKCFWAAERSDSGLNHVRPWLMICDLHVTYKHSDHCQDAQIVKESWSWAEKWNENSQTYFFRSSELGHNTPKLFHFFRCDLLLVHYSFVWEGECQEGSLV